MKPRALLLALALLAPLAPLANAAHAQIMASAQAQPKAQAQGPRLSDSIEVPVTPAVLVQPRDGLRNVFAKLKARQPVTIAYFGGSITEGAGASKEENTYRARTTRWFREQFPQSPITEVNAAIGGTGSDLGVFRLGRDVLGLKPDLILVEFAVNDGGAGTGQIIRGAEGIVRQARRALPLCDIAFVYTYVAAFQDELARGSYSRSMAAHDLVAAHYGIPSICVARPIAQRIAAGLMIASPQHGADGKELPPPPGVELFASDGVHPHDSSMQLYAGIITGAMPELQQAGAQGPRALPAPLASDNWEAAKLVALDASMLSPGWKLPDASEELARRFAKYFPQLWQGSAGDSLRFKFRGSSARLFDVMGPDAGQMKVTVDGQESKSLVSRFDSFSSYHRMSASTLFEGAAGVHQVQLEIVPQQPDRSSVTDKEKLKPGFDAKKYDGTAIRIGWLMLVGNLEK